MSWSWKWVFKGFVEIWKLLIYKFGFEKALRKWDFMLSLKCPLEFQVQLSAFFTI